MDKNIKVIVREARIEDVDAITDVYLDGAKYQYSLNKNLYRIPKREDVLAYNKEVFSNKQNKKENICFVAEVDGQVVGSIGVRLHKHGEQSLLRAKLSAELDISVKENMRGHGIGTKLISEASKWAKLQRADRIVLNTYVGNEKAINFYTKHNNMKVIGSVLAKDIA